MSSLDNKYRIHEVAKDFGLPSKTVTEILTDYIAAPKNHMQVLENPELDVIFEYLTQHNQVGSIAEIFAVPEKPKEAPKPSAQTLFNITRTIRTIQIVKCDYSVLNICSYAQLAC